MKKQLLKICTAACVIGVVSAAGVNGAELAPNVIGGDTSVSFSSQSLPVPQKRTADPDGTMPGTFVGNYLSAGIKAVGFRVELSGPTPSLCELYIYNNAANREWTRVVEVAGGDTSVAVPLSLAAGWAFWDVGGTEEMFIEDLQNISSIGVRFLRKGTDAQSYAVKDFVLLGGNSAEQSTELYSFMLASGVKDINADADGDGLSNWGEFLAKTDANDANSSFVLRIQMVPTANGVQLKWSHIADRKFAVWQADSLDSEYVKVAQDLSSNADGNSFDVDGAGAHFFKVEIQN